jgi:SAM-dependent methyltransferase
VKLLDAADYEAWYHTPRGQWIGGSEFQILRRLLLPAAGGSLLDVGCGTGYFTRRFASEAGLKTVGIDPNLSWIKFAEEHASGNETYQSGQAEHLPFADRSFDYTVSVAALCFVSDQPQAIREILSVTRKRFAIGLLNRHSLLYFQKGRRGGSGAYHGAHWHSSSEIRSLFAGLPVSNLVIRSAIFLPGGGVMSRVIESILPDRLPLGGFVAVAGDLGEAYRSPK